MPYTKKRYGTRKKWRKYKRAVAHIKKRGKVKSPYAVARASVYGKKRKK